MAHALSKGPRELRQEVLDADLCTGCGACLGICPHFRTRAEHVALIEPCIRAEGRCYTFCPRTATDLSALDLLSFGAERNDVALGQTRRVLMARARDERVRSRAQYGGVVTALSIYALDSGRVDAVLATASEVRRIEPRPILARSADEMLSAAGSKYTATPGLCLLNESARRGQKRVAVIGRGCQVTAARKMQLHDPDRSGGQVSLTIGLFCFWALRYRPLVAFLAQRLDLIQIDRLDIPRGELVVYTAGGETRLPVDLVRPFIQPSCNICFDPTAELGDVSVGSTEWMDDWNTVIVRSERGEELLDAAERAGSLEVRELPAERVGVLRQVTGAKKRRVIAQLARQSGDNSDLLYLHLTDAHRARVERELTE